MKKIELKIFGMHCASCEKLITMDLEDLSGINSIKIDSKEGKGFITADDALSSELIIESIKKSGYKAELINYSSTSR